MIEEEFAQTVKMIVESELSNEEKKQSNCRICFKNG